MEGAGKIYRGFVYIATRGIGGVGGSAHGHGNYFHGANTQSRQPAPPAVSQQQPAGSSQPAAASQHGNTTGEGEVRTKNKARRRQTASVKQTHKLSICEGRGRG